MTFGSEGILCFTGNSGLSRNVLCRYSHRVCAIKFFHARVGKTPAQRGIVSRQIAEGKPLLCFRKSVRRSRHTFHAASQIQIAIIISDSTVSHVHCTQPRSAQTVDRCRRHTDGNSGQKGRHARHIAAIFAGLVGTAQIDFFNCFWIQMVSFNKCPEDVCTHIVRPHFGQRSPQCPNRSAQRIHNHNFRHNFLQYKDSQEILPPKGNGLNHLSKVSRESAGNPLK